MAALKASLTEHVTTAVNSASNEMQQKLAAQIAESMEMATQKLGEEMRIFSSSMEGRMSRERESQELAITQLRNDHVALGEEVRNTLPTLKTIEQPSNGAGFRVNGGIEHDVGGGNVGAREREGFSGGFTGGTNWRIKKLDLPLFDGTNPDGWIMRAERYFSFYRLPEDEKLEAAVVSLEGDALLLYQWEHKRRPLRRWEEMKSLILRQFRPTATGSLHEQWLNHFQGSSVSDYRRRFIEQMAPLDNVSEDCKRAIY